MITFIKLLIAFILAILIVVAAAIAFVRWKFRSWMKKLVDIASSVSGNSIPPFRITIKARDDAEDNDWYHTEDMARLTKDFESLRFTAIGDYVTDEIPLQLRAFQHQEHHAYGMIYDHASAGCWCDVVRRYADETGWTVSSGTKHGMDPPPWHHPCFLPGQPVSDLMDRLLNTSPAEGLLKAGADLFIQRFTATYAREMNWRIERGGPTEEEIRRVASNDGQECTNDQIAAVQKQWRTAIADFLSDRVLKNWRKENDISATDFDRIRDRLVVVHNRLQPEQLLQIVDESNELNDDSDHDNLDATDPEAESLEQVRKLISESSVIVAFQKLLGEKKLLHLWKKTADVRKPLKAEIWERPGDPDDSDQQSQDEFDDELEI